MKKGIGVLILCLLASLTACGDSKMREVRSAFMEGCASGAGSQQHAACRCTFDQIEAHYSREQILDMENNILPDGFPEFAFRAMASCSKKD